MTLALAGMAFYVTTESGERFLARRATVWLSDWFRGQARIGELDLSLWRRELELRDFELIGADGQVHAKRAVARFQLWPPGNGWNITELTVNGLRLDFPFGLPSALQPRGGASGSGMPISIAKLQLSGAYVRWGGLPGGLAIEADRLASRGRLESAGFSGEVQAGPALLSGLPHPIRLRRIQTELKQRGARLTLRHAHAQIGGSRVEASGAIDFGAAPYRLKVRGSVRLEDVREWLPEALAGRGVVELEARLQPDPAGIRFAGAARAAARIPPWNEVFRTSADFAVTPSAVRIRQIEFAGLGGKAQGRFDWLLEPALGAPQIELSFSHIDLRRLLEPTLERELPLAAHASGAATLQLPAASPWLGTVQAQVQATRVVGAQLPLQGPVAIVLAAGGQRLEARLGSGRDTLDARLARAATGALSGRAVLSSADSADLWGRLEALLPSAARRLEPHGALLLNADLSGETAAPALELDGRLERLDTPLGPLEGLETDLQLLLGSEPAVRGEVVAQSARMQDLELGRLTARGWWTRRRLELERFQADLLAGHLTASGGYDGERIELDFQAGALDLARLGTDLALAGQLDSSGRLAGPIDRLEGAVELQARDLVLGQHCFGEVTSRARAAAGIVTLDLELPARQASAAATVLLQPDWPASIHLIAAPQSLEDLLGGLRPAEWSGELGLSAELGLELARPREISGSVTIAPLRLQLAGAELAAREPLRWTLDRGAITLEPARLEGADVSMRLAGRLEPFAPSRPFELEAELDTFPLEPLLTLAVRAGTELSGTASGSLRVVGELDHLAAARGQLSLEEFQAEVEGVRIHNRDPLVVGLEGSRLILDRFTLEGDQTLLDLRGAVELEPGLALDLQAAGSIDLVLLNPVLDFGAAGGKLILAATIQGRAAEPLISGHGWLQDGILRFYELPLRLGDARGRFAFDRSAVSILEFDADLGGGRLSATGSLALTGWRPAELTLQAQARGVRLRYPGALRGEYDADLELSGGPQRYRLGGEVQLLRGRYTEQIDLEELVYARLFGGKQPSSAPAPPLPLDFDLNLRTLQDLRVDNNLGRVSFSGELHLGGSAALPHLVGRVALRAGSQLRLLGRDFRLLSGSITWADPLQTIAALQITVETPVLDASSGRELAVRMTLSGPLDNLKLGLSSVPPKSEAQLVDLLIYGEIRGPEELGSGSVTEGMAGAQLLALLGGGATAPLTGSLGRSLGLQELRLDPVLLAGETSEPSARFTLRKALGRRAILTYSVNLRDAQDELWILDYLLRYGLTARALRGSEGNVAGGVRQRFTYGAPFSAELPEVQASRVSDVRLEGEWPIGEAAARKLIEVRVDRPLDLWQMDDDRDRLAAELRRHDYLRAEVWADIEPIADHQVRVVYRAEPSEPLRLRLFGVSSPDRIESELRQVPLGWLGWEDYLDEVRHLLQRHLIEQGYLSPKIRHEVIEGQPRELRLQVESGPRYVLGQFEISGLESEAAEQLRELLDLHRGEWSRSLNDLATDPERIERVTQAWLEQQGLLRARIANIESKLDQRHGEVTARIIIRDARPLTVARITFDGPMPLPETELRNTLRLRAGDRYRPESAEQDRARLGERLRQVGYADAKIGWSAAPVAERDQVELRYALEPGAAARVAGIEVLGNPRTDDGIVRRYLGFEIGDPLNPDRLRAAEQRLLETGLYRRVSISAVPPDAVERIVRVELIEEAPFHIDYGARYDSDSGPQVDIEWSDRNFFGRGREGLLQALVSDDFRTVRGGIGEDFPFGWRLPTLFSGFWEWQRETQTPAPGSSSTLLEKSFGLSVEQRLAISQRQVLLYGYRWKRVRSESILISPDFGVIVVPPITRFDAALATNYVADNRDLASRASRGRFLSLGLEWHESALGASQSYLRGLEQLFVHQRIAAGWVAAAALRFGFSVGLGGDRPLEGFRIGGGTTLRGFERDAIGVNQAGVITEGDAMVLSNLELRSPLWHGLGTVLFYDAGNVFARLRDLQPFNLRSGAGLGLRYDSPFGLLRLDWGFNLDPQGNEPSSTLFFSFGDMF